MHIIIIIILTAIIFLFKQIQKLFFNEFYVTNQVDIGKWYKYG